MSALSSIARTVYLLCLTITLSIAMISLLSGAGFDVMITRMALALVGSGILGWAAILALLPTVPNPSGGQTATEERLSIAAQPSAPEPISIGQGQADHSPPGDTIEEGQEEPASA
jgi:hypothetical protein